MKKNGFTYIELIISIVLIGIIAAIASELLAQGLNAFLTTQNITDANWQGQLAMERMIRDIRDIRSASDVSTNTATSLTFVDMLGNSIAYSLSGSNLMRNSDVLARGVSALAFTYYDNNGAVAGSTATLHYIKIGLTVSQNNTNYTLTTTAFLRDLST